MKKNRIVIYDFDGTLFKSPTREEGLKLYENYCFENAITFSGDFPFRGWWGRLESLVPPIVSENLNSDHFISHVVEAYNLDILDDSTEVILMTGRPIKLKDRVLEICSSYNLLFDRTFFTGQQGSIGSNTGEIKTNFIQNHILRADLEFFEIWEDRPEHVELFCQNALIWIRNSNLKEITVHDVKTGKKHIIA